jgi:diguanylate cyclase (GGDEF)-like protein
MKRDWSVLRITVLLYLIVILIPVNYIIAAQMFQSMDDDAYAIREIGFINGTIQRIVKSDENRGRNDLVGRVESAFSMVEDRFILKSENEAYVALFRADELYKQLNVCWRKLKSDIVQKRSDSVLYEQSERCWEIGNDVAVVMERLTEYKTQKLMNTLFITLAVTMLAVILLIYLVRVFIRVQISRQAIHDPVTGLYNKKYYREAIEQSCKLAKRRESPLSVLSLTIDNLHGIVKETGTKGKARLLGAFGDQLNGLFRQSDTICYLGEEGFAVITPDADIANAVMVSEKVRESIERHNFMAEESVTLSIGVSELKNDDTPESLMERAVRARKRAQEKGGNRVAAEPVLKEA